jgi:N-methylhydantoinase A
MRLIREADVRYVGQSMEVRIAAPGGAVDSGFLVRLIDAFHAAHLKTFGYNYAGESGSNGRRQKVEVVNFCVSGFGLIERPHIPLLPTGGDAMPAPRSTRAVYFDGAFCATPIFDRAALRPGAHVEGAAVVEEFGSTTVVFPGQHLEVDPQGILLIRPKRMQKPAR